MPEVEAPCFDETVYQHIKDYKHPDTVRRMSAELKLLPQEAEDLFTDVKRFLYICYLCDDSLPPPERIRNGWPHFIHFDANYAAFCETYFGKIIPCRSAAHAENERAVHVYIAESCGAPV